MNVFSAFDGISCGQLALQRAGIKVDKYYASEIDKHAIKVTMHHFPNTIQVGNITQIKANDLSKIDLLIGGSPCQGFSFQGNRLNFEDPRSKLFFEFVRLLKELEPTYFLLENVKMSRKSQDVISSALHVKPIVINSNIITAQNRHRLYWTNIPNVTIPENKTIVLKDILDTDYDAIISYAVSEKMAKIAKEGKYSINKLDSIYGKSMPVMAGFGSGGNKIFIECPVLHKIRKLTPVECERLQTLPDNYTDILPSSARYKAIGNGWTIDIITHILKGIK